jgi:hypothetical protein
MKPTRIREQKNGGKELRKKRSRKTDGDIRKKVGANSEEEGVQGKVNGISSVKERSKRRSEGSNQYGNESRGW